MAKNWERGERISVFCAVWREEEEATHAFDALREQLVDVRGGVERIKPEELACNVLRCSFSLGASLGGVSEALLPGVVKDLGMREGGIIRGIPSDVYRQSITRKMTYPAE